MFHQDARNSIRKQFNISKLQIRLKWIVISRIAGVAYSRTEYWLQPPAYAQYSFYLM